MKRLLFVPLMTAAGALLGGLGWLLIFALTYHPPIGLEPTASTTLFFSVVLSCVVSGIGAIVYAHSQIPRRSMLEVFMLVFVGGVLACTIVGVTTYNFAFSQWPDGHGCDAHPKTCVD